MKNFKQVFLEAERLCKKWENYFEIYDKHLEKYKYTQPKILEIGVAHGGSTEMLKKYFGLCDIHCVDYDPMALNVVEGLNVKVTQGDQADSQFWDSYLTDKPDFDIIIDDGGHEMEQQIITLLKTYPRLKTGGTYIVEDTHTSYWHKWYGGYKNPNSFIETVKGLIDLLHAPFIVDYSPREELKNIFENLWSITFYNSIVVFEKKDLVEPVEAINKKINDEPKLEL